MGEQELGEVAVGTRVSCDGHYGVVRYCGPVVDTKGERDVHGWALSGTTHIVASTMAVTRTSSTSSRGELIHSIE
ncbi:hypothetical protein HPB51_019906 [Rhipicephalus microplus]|uniref:Uncharacterized protein n=1 Tax=Rhipicephalus microplus TaxID=6941 RepID=A0A9J6E3B5_RHIMP|nr:hypothetical protein HPB51_019906 [Rhipicephalus microplus]